MSVNAGRLARPLRQVHRRLGAYSKSGAIALLDGRSREFQLMKRIRADLVAHCGGAPTAVQRQLIERAVRLSLKLELLDEQMMHGAIFEDRDDNCYLAWSNGLTRTLQAIGINAQKPKARTVDEAIGQAEQGEEAA
jgi:hypothetical protein